MTGVRDSAAEAFSGYAHEHRPLRAYGVLTGTFAAAFTGALLAAVRSGRPLPARIGIGDVVLMGVATHKVSRLVAKDRVTSFIRAPFTEYQEASGQGEVEEKARGAGMHLALGELLICPYCLAQWVAAAFGCGLVAAPRLTRLVAGIYTAETVSDFLQLAYHGLEERS